MTVSAAGMQQSQRVAFRSPPKNAAIRKIVNGENKALCVIRFTGAADVNIHAFFFTSQSKHCHDSGV
jgi:hypothetical protein